MTEVDQPWTPAELEQLERTEQRQRRQKFDVFPLLGIAKTAMEIVVSGECQQAFLTPQDISPEDAEALYNQARYAVMERAFQTDKPVEYQQLEVMRELNRMGVLEFFEL